MKSQTPPIFAQGMSIVELMVAITIGLVILAAVSTVFVNSKANYTTQESTARLQESARFAMHFLTRDLRMVGYYGCADDIDSIHSLLNPSAATDPDPYSFATPIEAVEGNAAVFYPSSRPIAFPTAGTAVTAKDPPGKDCPDYVGGKCTLTDAVGVRMVDPSTSVALTAAMPNTSAKAFVEAGHGLAAGDIVLLSDCGSAELFQITNIQTEGLVHNSGNSGFSPGNSTQKFERTFGPPGGNVMKFVNRVYYVGTGSSGHPALFRSNFDGTNREELLDGIEDLQVAFGKATTSDRTPRVYLTASDAGLGTTAANWANVVSVRISLKARPVISGANQTNTNNNNEVKAQEFTSTVLLRNLQ